MNDQADEPVSSRTVSWFAVGTGAVLLVVIAVWALILAGSAGTTTAAAVVAPAPAVEVSGTVHNAPKGVAGAQGAFLGARVDEAWNERIAASTGIPSRALEAYARAALLIDAEQPECGVGWNTLAGIGAIESDHGRHGGAELSAEGYPSPPIRGPQLDGEGNAAIRDTDRGEWDGDTVWDRAVGPMQFIPGTWSRWGADADGDGRADPNQIDDAALAAARYLCESGDMTSVEGWRAAVFSYNHLDSYVNDVAVVANRYAEATR